MIWFVIQQFNFEFINFGDAIHINLFSKQAFFVKNNPPEILYLLRW